MYNSNMWKKILVLSILLAIVLMAFLNLCGRALFNDDVYACIRTNEFPVFILFAVLSGCPTIHLYKRIFKKKIEKNPASFYSKSWFIKLVCGFVVISTDIILIYLLRSHRHPIFTEISWVIFILSYGLFATYTIMTELINNILVTLEAIEKNG